MLATLAVPFSIGPGPDRIKPQAYLPRSAWGAAFRGDLGMKECHRGHALNKENLYSIVYMGSVRNYCKMCRTDYRRLRRGHKPKKIQTLSERFWSHVNKTSSCWLWTARCGGGMNYGQFAIKKNGYWGMVVAHRWAYEEKRGAIQDGLTLDHLCRTPACVNPTHLEAVTMRENVLRGTGVAAQNSKKKVCPRGHPYDTKTSNGGRGCHRCMLVAYRRYKAKKAKMPIPAYASTLASATRKEAPR